MDLLVNSIRGWPFIDEIVLKILSVLPVLWVILQMSVEMFEKQAILTDQRWRRARGL